MLLVSLYADNMHTSVNATEQLQCMQGGTVALRFYLRAPPLEALIIRKAEAG